MNTLTTEELKTLAEHQADLCISLYMPMHRPATEAPREQIQLRNLLRHAEKQMLAEGIRSTQVKTLLEPAQEILADAFFWRRPGDSLAMFLSAQVFRHYGLPLALEESVIVGRRFHLKRLLPLFNSDDRFYVLALSQSRIKLFHGTRFGVSEVELRHMPTSLAEALKDVETEKESDYHQIAAPVGTGRVAIHFGNAAGTDDRKVRLLEYFHKIDGGLREMLAQTQLPLVLAAVDYLCPIYLEANTYPHLLSDRIVGCPNKLGAKELHERAWAIVQPHLDKRQDEAIVLFERNAGGERASSDLTQIVRAAFQGQIALLLMTRSLEIWGKYNADSNQLDLHKEMEPGDDDLLDLAAIQTFLNGGKVYLMARDKMPQHVAIAAVFRY